MSIDITGVTKKFGDFVALDNVSGKTQTATLMVEEKYQNFAQGSAYAIAFLLVMVCIACLVVVAVLRPQDEN